MGPAAAAVCQAWLLAIPCLLRHGPRAAVSGERERESGAEWSALTTVVALLVVHQRQSGKAGLM